MPFRAQYKQLSAWSPCLSGEEYRDYFRFLWNIRTSRGVSYETRDPADGPWVESPPVLAYFDPLGAPPQTPVFFTLRQWHDRDSPASRRFRAGMGPPAGRSCETKPIRDRVGATVSGLRRRGYGESGTQAASENDANGPAVGYPGIPLFHRSTIPIRRRSRQTNPMRGSRDGAPGAAAGIGFVCATDVFSGTGIASEPTRTNEFAHAAHPRGPLLTHPPPSGGRLSGGGVRSPQHRRNWVRLARMQCRREGRARR
jgi:hypothetical protein